MFGGYFFMDTRSLSEPVSNNTLMKLFLQLDDKCLWFVED